MHESRELFNIGGKVALVTGSTGAIGSTLAEGLCANGATVILHGRQEDRLMDQYKIFKAKGYSVYTFLSDLTETEDLNGRIRLLEKGTGPIDILVNNAGITIRNPLEVYPDSDWDKIIALNLTAVFRMSRAVAPAMIARQSGKIINIGSIQCELGRPSITPYAATKGAVKMLTRGMAVEWARHNIQVNGIGPGYFKSEMTRPLYENPDFDRWVCERTPSGRWGNTEELVGALLLLASDASTFINGQMLYVDGGLLVSV